MLYNILVKLKGPLWPKKKGYFMKRNDLTYKIVGNALLVALTVVFTLISNNIPIAGISINLSLITIAVAAILFGKVSGLLVGFVNGGLVMLSAAPFFAINPVATVFVCLLKSGLAGLVAALVYQLFLKINEHVGVILATILVPIINTTIFIIGSLLFFGGALGDLITLFVAANFIIEFIINLVLSPAVYYIVRIYKKNHQKLA